MQKNIINFLLILLVFLPSCSSFQKELILKEQLKTQKELEQHLEQKAQKYLDTVRGKNRSLVQVSADIQINKNNQKSDSFIIERLYISVLLDGEYECSRDSQGNIIKNSATYRFISPRTIDTYTNFLKIVVGFDSKRGDSILVHNTKFHNASPCTR